MTNREIRYYYTLEELFEDFDLEAVQQLATELTKSAGTLAEEFGDVLSILKDEYYDWFIGFVDKPLALPFQDTAQPTEAEIDALKKKFIRKLITTYNFTKDRYIYLLNLYVEQKDNLMNQLNTVVDVTSHHRVNDTPQNGGTWENDKHTSAYEEGGSTTTTNTDPKTIMERINEIQDHYMNVLKNWCKEFDQLFIAPNNEFESEE